LPRSAAARYRRYERSKFPSLPTRRSERSSKRGNPTCAGWVKGQESEASCFVPRTSNACAAVERWNHAASAPKGRNTKAQGNALGKRSGSDNQALKGRNMRPPGSYLALSGLPISCSTRSPRALPWALVLRPFGADQGRQTPGCMEQNQYPGNSPHHPYLHLSTRELTRQDSTGLISQIVISKGGRGGRHKPPWVLNRMIERPAVPSRRIGLYVQKKEAEPDNP
jgi:hypothetical protein